MRIRSLWLVFALAGAVGAVAGCTAKNADTETDAGAAGAAGVGGTAGSGGATTDAGANPCGDVPASGVCSADKRSITACRVPDDPNGVPKVVVAQCSADRVCDDSTGTAQCKLVGECTEGDKRCSAGTQTSPGGSLQTCVGSMANAKWQDTPCPQDQKCVTTKPGNPAKCTAVPSGSGTNKITLEGRVRYEYRPVREDRKGFDYDNAPQVAEAFDVYVGIYDNDEMIGKALAGYDIDNKIFKFDGTFKAELTKAPTDNTVVYVWPMAFNYDTGQPLMAVAKMTNSDPDDSAQHCKEYHWFGVNYKDKAVAGTGTDGKYAMNDWVIKESEFSGAIHIYRQIDDGLIRADAANLAAGGKVKQKSLVVYWNGKDTPSCGACFCGPQCGGGKVKYGSSATEMDEYDTWIVLGGPKNDGETQWATSVIHHEFGHYAMSNYSKSPGEGGPHYVGQASAPGLAYSEGWATSWGQESVGNPIYVDVQDGTAFWVDIQNYEYSNGKLQKPNPDGPIEQPINENVVAGMMWKLWAEPTAHKDSDGQSLQDPKIFTAFMHPGLVNGSMNRGYVKVDLVDFFDAAVCSKAGSEANVNAVSKTAGYPYSFKQDYCK
jgi:hypothetical protein